MKRFPSPGRTINPAHLMLNNPGDSGANNPNANPSSVESSPKANPSSGESSPVDPTDLQEDYPTMSFFNSDKRDGTGWCGKFYRSYDGTYLKYLPDMYHDEDLQLYSSKSKHASADIAPARPIPELIPKIPADPNSKLFVVGAPNASGFYLLGNNGNTKFAPYYAEFKSHFNREIYYLDKSTNTLVLTHYNSGSSPVAIFNAQKPEV